MRPGTEARIGNARFLRGKAEGCSNSAEAMAGKQKVKPKSRKETPSQQGQSSEKSSQDRLSVLDKEEKDGWPGEAPTSSLNADAMLASETLERPARLSSLRTRSRASKHTVPADISPKCENCTDPDWSPTASPRHEEAVSCSIADAEASVHRARSSKALDLVATKASIEAACRQAQNKKQKAAELVAMARSFALEASRASKRQRLQPKLGHRASAGNSPVLGARVAVYWPNDKQFYKGKVISVKGDAYDYQIEYDDLWTEWLCLSNERFRLVGPRALSAGCTDALLGQLQSLEAEGLPLARDAATPCHKPAEGETPTGEGALGWMVSVLGWADNCYHEGQLIAHKPSSGLHHILYQDGEDEWLCLQEEQIQWLQHLDKPSHAGLKYGESAPAGEDAVGWQMAVYWRASCQFFLASVTDYNSREKQHLVTYSNGDEEYICLSSQCIKWTQIPQSKQTSSSGEPRGNCAFDRKWAFKTSRPRSSRMACAKRQSSWGNLDLQAKEGGSESGKHDRAIGDSPVSGIFEYVGPSPDKLPMLLGRHSSHGYLADADKTAETDTPQDSNSAYKSGLLSTDSDLHSLPSKLSSQALCPVDGPNPWRMGSPFQGLELASEGVLPGLNFTKREVDCEGRLILQLEEKLLGVIDRPYTAPSPVPLLENVSHPPFSESLLVGDHIDCHPSPHNTMGSGHISSDSLEGSDDYLDIHALMEMPAENSPSDWFTLQPL